jgi:acyl-CoA synthetase (AMP-forming)/AMP-acid ligase II
MAQQSSAGPNHLLIITDDQPHYMQNANITPHIAASIANHGLKWVQGSWANIPVVEHCKEHLAGYKKPSYVAFVEELPRNAAGKGLRRELRRLHGEGDDE